MHRAPPVATPPVTAPPVTAPPVTAPPAPPVVHPTAPVVASTVSPIATTGGTPPPPAAGLQWGCGAALAYLSAHANPAYTLVCPGYAEGHQAMTCNELAAICPGSNDIVINIPCPAAYQNEAWNSWHIVNGPFDPYGSCPGYQD